MRSPTRHRTLAGLTVAAVALATLVGCSDAVDTTDPGMLEPTTPAETTAGEGDTAADPLSIAFIYPTSANEYYSFALAGAKAAADELNIEIVDMESGGSQEGELANVEDAIAQDVDGMVIFSVSKASLTAGANKASAADIPIAVLYGYAPELEEQAVVFVQTPSDAMGALAGTWMAENVPSGEVAIIQGALGRGDAESYTENFIAALGANPDLEIVASPEGGWDRAKAQAAMADILTAHPNLSGAFVQNDDMAAGALASIKAAGKEGQVSIVSLNGSPNGLKMVQAGELGATVSNSPSLESQMALARLVEFIRNGTEPAERVCNAPTVVVTKANLDEVPPWDPTPESTTASLTANCAS